MFSFACAWGLYFLPSRLISMATKKRETYSREKISLKRRVELGRVQKVRNGKPKDSFWILKEYQLSKSGLDIDCWHYCMPYWKKNTLEDCDQCFFFFILKPMWLPLYLPEQGTLPCIPDLIWGRLLTTPVYTYTDTVRYHPSEYTPHIHW